MERRRITTLGDGVPFTYAIHFLSRKPDVLRSYVGRDSTRSLVASTTSRTVNLDGETSLPAFPEAVEAHKTMVYSIAWHFLRDRAVAEELSQDVFLELHRNWSSMQSGQHIVFWLRKVTSRRSIDVMRKRRTRAETSLEEMAEPTALERVHDSMLSSYLERMVASLPEKQRIVIVLRYQEGMEPEEIAEVLRMNVNTVKSQIARALELLRAKTAHRLKQEGDRNDPV
jgi:RNA polymerase sigma-70 factor, ECF subfamily